MKLKPQRHKANYKSLALILADIVIVNLAYPIMVLIYWNFRYSPDLMLKLLIRIPFVTLFYIGSYSVSKLYRSVWKYAGIYELFRYAAATAAGTILVWLADYIGMKICRHAGSEILYFNVLPWSIYLDCSLIIICACLTVRLAPRSFKVASAESSRAKRSNTRILILGAGVAGSSLVHEFQQNGYRFGNQDVYCPWDIINYVNELRSDPEAEPKPYWMNTSGNDMVRRLIAKASDGTTQMEIERLIAGDTITKMINEQLTHSEIDENLENIWSLLYMTGYLTVARKPSGGRYELRIPNREVREIFKRQVLSWFTERARAATEKLARLYEAFEKGDAEAIEKLLNRQLITTVSFYDAYESFYHGFLLALLSTCVDWCVSSNAETGRGRSDITVERRDRELGFVIEIKEVRTRAKLDEACAAAMKQAEDRDYAAVMLRYGVETVFTYGIAFCDKRCRVAVKRVENTDEI